MCQQDSLYRILDASANRAAEALRCLEECARFIQDDAEATQRWKTARHDLAAAVTTLSRTRLLAARDTGGDVGTELALPSESSRPSIAAVVAAAGARVSQSLRVLEEYGKTIDPGFAATIEQLRYRCYDLAAALELSVRPHRRQQRLGDARLYALVDAGADAVSFARHIRRMFRAGVDVIQLRDRKHDDRTLIARAQAGSQIAGEWDGLFLVNDRADLALAAGADGVHVGQEELPVVVARQIVGGDRLIGVSTHDVDQARQAVNDGADYIGCGPVFPGTTKAFEAYVGTSLLQEVSRQIELPTFAIGGIDLQNVDQVITAGIHRIAVTGALRDADDLESVAASLQARLRAGPPMQTPR